VKVVRSTEELAPARRAVAIGTFDGVHLGHRRVLDATRAAGPISTVVTFDPHPRAALGESVELITGVRRRVELLTGLGVEDVLVVPFDAELAGIDAAEFAERVLRPIGTEVVVAGSGFRFGRGRSGDLGTLAALGFDVRPVPVAEGLSSSAIRGLLRAGDVGAAALLLGRPYELDGTVVRGHARGAGLGFPTANLALAPELLVPAHGIYAGAALGHRAAISIGTNPHYGGRQLSVEAFLLDYHGDLYGHRVVVEVWQRLRTELAFKDEEELIAQIGRDVGEASAAIRPV